jgi:hypothetical protein
MKIPLLIALVFTVPIGATVLGTSACTPAQSATISHLESIVLADINSGKGFEAAVTDAAAYIASQPGFGVVTDIVALVSDIIHALIDMGVLSPPKVEHAKAMLLEGQTFKLHTPAASK